MVYPTYADVVQIIIQDEGCAAPEYHVVRRTRKYMAFCCAFGEDYKGWVSCCALCAINSCAKMVYMDLQDRCLLQKVTKDGKTLPIPLDDYVCLTELEKNENGIVTDVDSGYSEP